MCGCVYVHVCQSEHVEERGQLMEANCLLPPCGLWELNSGHIHTYIYIYSFIYSIISVLLENLDNYTALVNNVHQVDIK